MDAKDKHSQTASRIAKARPPRDAWRAAEDGALNRLKQGATPTAAGYIRKKRYYSPCLSEHPFQERHVLSLHGLPLRIVHHVFVLKGAVVRGSEAPQRLRRCSYSSSPSSAPVRSPCSALVFQGGPGCVAPSVRPHGCSSPSRRIGCSTRATRQIRNNSRPTLEAARRRAC